MRREITWRVFYQDEDIKVDFDMNTITVDAIATILRAVDLESFINQPATDNTLMKVYVAISEKVDELRRNGTLFWDGSPTSLKWQTRPETSRDSLLKTAALLEPRDVAWMSSNAPTKALLDHARAVEAFLTAEGKMTRNDEGGFC